jgi:hypothetical protein
MKSNAGAGGPKLIRRSAIKAKGDALAANPNLVALIQAERWNGVLPTTLVPGSTVPFLNVH